MTPDQEYVLKTVKSRDVHFVRFWFTDVLGRMKSFAVSPNELVHAFEEGIGFDGSSVDGFAGSQVCDMLAFPEAATFQVLPWRPDSDAVARMFCTIKTPQGELFESDPRRILARAMDRAAQAGYEFNLGPEVEYFYFRDSGVGPDGKPVLLDKGGYFDLTSLDSASDLRRDTVLTLEKMGIPVEYSHHESGPSQHEVDLRFSDAMSMADAVMTYKMVVKEVAASHGVFASFMPMPRSDTPGSGMHLHMSLFDEEGRNAFFDPAAADAMYLSDVARHFIAGVLHFAPEYCLITNQFVNSYKRLAHPSTPHFVGWGQTSRSTIVRVPGHKPTKELGCRIVLRSPDPACNPYLACAAVLSAGLEGIKQQMDPGEPCDGDACGFSLLPETLGEALGLFESSELMRDVLGAHVHRYLIEQKRAEWREFLAGVTDWEIERYLEVL